jgi:hypothetical protein
MNKKILMALVLGIFMFNFASAALIDDLIPYWNFDETNGTVLVDQNSVYNGTNNGATVGETGILDKAYDFEDTESDYVSVGNFQNFVNFKNGSFSIWVNIESYSSFAFVFEHFNIADNDRFYVGATSTGNGLNFALGNSGTATYATSTGAWHHIVGTWNGTSAKFYIDGVLKETKTYTYGNPTTNGFDIGRAESTTDRYFDGLIDEFGIWNRTMNQSEITELYNSGNALAYPFAPKNPLLVDLISPVNNSKQSGNISFEADLNFTNINATNATLNIWYGNGTLFKSVNQNVSINNSNITINFDNINGFSSNTFLWNILAFGTNGTHIFNGTADNNFTFEWRPFEENSFTFNNNSIETDNQEFILNITTLENILSVSAVINYDGEMSQSDVSCGSGVCILTNNIDVTTVDSGQFQNKTFFWEIIVFDGTDSFSFNSTSRNQTLERIFLEQCNATFTIQTLNFTGIDEQNLTSVSPFTFESIFKIWSGSGNTFRNITFDKSGLSSLQLCLQPTNETFKINMQSDYSDDSGNFAKRTYFLENHEISNSSQDIILLFLLNSEATTFIIEVIEDSQAIIKNALVIIDKFFPGENIYRTAQILRTDENGQDIAFLEAENVEYRFTIIKDGTQLLQSENRKAFSEVTPFKIQFIISDTIGAPWDPFVNLGNLNKSLTFNNNTNIVSFIYIDSSGEFGLSRLIVEHIQGNGTNTVICNITSILASATLPCDVTGFEGLITASAFITRNSVENLVVTIQELISDAKDIFGLEGLFLAMLLLMVAYGLISININLGLIVGMFVTILINFTNLVSIPPLILYAIIGLTLIILAAVNKR